MIAVDLCWVSVMRVMGELGMKRESGLCVMPHCGYELPAVQVKCGEVLEACSDLDSEVEAGSDYPC